MNPELIKAALRMKGVTPTVLAEEMGVARSTMSQVISGRSESSRIKERIAQITGMTVSEMWPPTGRPVLRRTRVPQKVASKTA